ncbi:TonB-dependent receptor [Nibrella saemangeumensis]|uniref:TonB-dependent receptor n=1 Tax=Nibrella saemangeumensis TaxID=1084526 RepID=A0ABP8N8N3_9BACT
MSLRSLLSYILLAVFLPAIAWSQTLTGTVRDQQTQRPLAGVTIRIPETTYGTLTNEEGRFELRKVPAGRYSLQIRSVGYQTLEPVIEPGQESLVIDLPPAIIQLNQLTVVTTQRTETPDFLRPEMTTILTPRDLQQRTARTVPEALLGATGVWLQKTNHGGGSPFVRGLTGQQTLLLVDGIRLNNATFRSGPNQYLNTIDPQSLEQIEVVRSTGSVAYGSDAIGGVINVLTKTPQFSEEGTFSGNTFFKAMTHGMELTNRTELGYSSSSVAVQGGLAYRMFGDLVAGKGLGRQSPTGYNQVSGDLKARFRLSNRYTLTAAYQNLRQDSVPVYHKVRLENFRYNQFNPQRRQLGYLRLEGFYNYRWLQSVQVTASWQRQTEGRQSQKNDSPTAVLERDETTTQGLTVLALSEPTSFWQIRSGIEVYSDFVRSSRIDRNTQTGAETAKRGLYPDRATMNSLAAFTLHTLTFDRLTLTGGGRYNTYQITIPEQTLGKSTISPSALVGNVGASYAVVPQVRVVASVQSAFRAPNIDDMGTLGIVDFRYETPNSNLEPERSLNTEAGVKVRTGRFSASVLGYYTRLTNFISRVRMGRDSIQGYPVYLKQNSAEAFIRGLETEAEWEFARNWLAYGSLVYTYGQNVTANEPFRRIPPLNSRMGVTYQSPASFWVRAEVLLAGAQTRLAKGDMDDNRIGKSGTPGWQVVNLNGGYQWRSFMVSAELQNLFNEAYRTHGSGVAGTGRSAWLAVQYRF